MNDADGAGLLIVIGKLGIGIRQLEDEVVRLQQENSEQAARIKALTPDPYFTCDECSFNTVDPDELVAHKRDRDAHPRPTT